MVDCSNCTAHGIITNPNDYTEWYDLQMRITSEMGLCKIAREKGYIQIEEGYLRSKEEPYRTWCEGYTGKI